jgi:hypothetical protein
MGLTSTHPHVLAKIGENQGSVSHFRREASNEKAKKNFAGSEPSLPSSEFLESAPRRELKKLSRSRKGRLPGDSGWWGECGACG